MEPPSEVPQLVSSSNENEILWSSWRSKEEIVSDVLLWAPKHGHASVDRPCPTYIQQLCEDAGCRPEDLPRTMEDREGGRESQASKKKTKDMTEVIVELLADSRNDLRQ
ncbi:hypothetical protein Bbelb_334310 [Branchiostoma belcheri]|nr:hypothetical protein Bbelb_334310 [Branchiostoma belcheri]